jgi:hypothetical protein
VTQNIQAENPLADLNRKAKAARLGDPTAVRALTDEAFNTFAPAEVPVFTREVMKERVARAEVDYRRGVDKGISEVKVANTINELADKFQLPDYAKVSVAMVRTARVVLMLQLPNLVAQNNPASRNHKKTIGSSINPSMSPVEATTLTLFVLQQKMLNEAFQVTHSEFYAGIQQRQVESWRELRAKRNGDSKTIVDQQTAPSMQVRSNTRSDELRQAVNKAVAHMSPDVLLNLADSSLDTLGLKR